MKRISYQYQHEYEDKLRRRVVECADDIFDANYAIAQREAVGEITVEDVEQSPEERLAELHRQLTATDYIDNKIVEALMTNGMDAAQAVADEYADTLAQRQTWRDDINRLEAEEVTEP